MKTVKEHLKTLPLQKRLQATENIRFYRGLAFLKHKQSKQDLLFNSFIFHKTRQGHDYWKYLNCLYFG